jgi:hypothetical protein
MTSREKSSGDARDSDQLLAITLSASNTPMPLPALNNEQLRGFALFKSRRMEDGRERHRLHLGYFLSYVEAERVLAIVRPTYPRAMIAAVPQDSMGSLDNTSTTRFSILQPVPRTQAPAEPPSAVAARVTVLPTRRAAMTPESAAAPSVAEAPVIPLPVQQGAPASAREPIASGNTSSSRVPVQRYAVQLAFGREPIDISKLPHLAIYEGYLLYAIETEPGGRKLYGIRLGFYDDALSARLVAQYVRSDFKEVAIVPVSDREVARATTAKIRLPSVRAPRGTGSSLPLWPRSALTVSFDPGSHLSLAT